MMFLIAKKLTLILFIMILSQLSIALILPNMPI